MFSTVDYTLCFPRHTIFPLAVCSNSETDPIHSDKVSASQRLATCVVVLVFSYIFRARIISFTDYRDQRPCLPKIEMEDGEKQLVMDKHMQEKRCDTDLEEWCIYST